MSSPDKSPPPTTAEKLFCNIEIKSNQLAQAVTLFEGVVLSVPHRKELSDHLRNLIRTLQRYAVRLDGSQARGDIIQSLHHLQQNTQTTPKNQ